jgi:integrase
MIDRCVREFGALILDEMTVRRVERYRDERLQQVKVTTVNRETYVLVACVRRWATVMRADGCTTPDPRDLLAGLTRRTPKDTETRWFSESEFARFIEALQGQAAILGIPRAEGLAMAYTAVETLLRLSSLLRLTWPMYRGTHLVPLNAKVKILESPVTPNMQQLFAALPTNTDRLFASFDRVAARAKRHGIILSDARRHAAAAGIADRWFAEVCRLAELPCGREHHGVTFHSFRHTGATWLLNGSATRPPVSVKTVMALGGWKNVRTFMNTYCHTDTQMVRAAASSLFPVVKPALVARDTSAS